MRVRLLVALLASPIVLVAAGGAEPIAPQPKAPRTPWGDPDLQGVWNYATMTPLERPRDVMGKPVLTPEEAGAVAAALRQQRLAHLAAQRAFPANRAEVKALLTELVASSGGAGMAAAVLDGIAAVPRAAGPEPVWTAPSVPGLEGRTTLAIADLINRAVATVYAATYSAGAGADYVQALAHAIDRGVAVRVILFEHFTDDTGAFPEGPVGLQAHLLHRVQNAPVHRLEAVANVR